MGKASVIRPVQYQGLPRFSASGSSANGSFLVTNVKNDLVSVDPFSYLLEDFDIKNNIPVLGLDYAFQLLYGEKIYLETVFDTSGQVAYARIDNEAYWPIKRNNPNANANDDNDDGGTIIYPDMIAILGKDDQEFYESFISDQKTRINAQETAHVNYLDTLLTGDADTDKVITDKIVNVQKQYTAALKKLTTIQNTQSTFFSSVANIRKQISSYNVIAYTTKDTAAQLHSFSITPPTTTDTGGDEDPTFQVVQCLSKDLMLFDAFHKQTSCRYPLEFSHPVYYFQNPDTKLAEDDENTDPTKQSGN